MHRVAAPNFINHADLHAKVIVLFPSEFQNIDNGVAYLDELINFKLYLPLRQVRGLGHNIGGGTAEILVHKLYENPLENHGILRRLEVLRLVFVVAISFLFSLNINRLSKTGEQR